MCSSLTQSATGASIYKRTQLGHEITIEFFMFDIALHATKHAKNHDQLLSPQNTASSIISATNICHLIDSAHENIHIQHTGPVGETRSVACEGIILLQPHVVECCLRPILKSSILESRAPKIK